jgi:hypothetical protein
MSASPDRARPLWRVVRLDENGNCFEVARGLSQRAAGLLIDDYERKGHKQTYCKEVQPCIFRND